MPPQRGMAPFMRRFRVAHVTQGEKDCGVGEEDGEERKRRTEENSRRKGRGGMKEKRVGKPDGS